MSARGKLCAEGEIYKARGSYCERNNTACLLCAPSEPTPSNPKDTNSELMSTGLKLASAQHSVCSHHMARLPHSIIILCRAPRPARTRTQHHVSVAQREFRNPPPRDSQRMKRLSSKMAHVFNRGPRWICPILTEQNGEGTCQYETEQGDTVLTLP